MKECIMNLTPAFDARRMVDDYDRKYYKPSHKNWERMAGSGFEEARQRARWNARVREVWPRINFVEMDTPPAVPIMAGKPVTVRTVVNLAGLQPSDVRVECVLGRIGASGSLDAGQIFLLPNTRVDGDRATFEKEITPDETGRLGYAVRLSPNHYDDPMTRPVTSMIKWAAR
jgi:starch phosphorylase